MEVYGAHCPSDKSSFYTNRAESDDLYDEEKP